MGPVWVHSGEQPSSVSPGTQRQLQWLHGLQVLRAGGPAGSSSLVSVKGPPCPTGAPFHVSGEMGQDAARTGVINPGTRQEWQQCEAVSCAPCHSQKLELLHGHTAAGSTPFQAEELAGLPRGCRGDDSSPVPSIFISYSYKLPEEAEAWHTDTQDACSRCSTAGLDHK